MHYRGKSFRFTAKYPGGGEEILLDVPHYDFNWQTVYQLTEPKLMPEGTVLMCDRFVRQLGRQSGQSRPDEAKLHGAIKRGTK